MHMEMKSAYLISHAFLSVGTISSRLVFESRDRQGNAWNSKNVPKQAASQ